MLKKISVSNLKNDLKVILSKYLLDKRTKALTNKLPYSQIEHYSSSLKFCRLAEGKAHLYPRLEKFIVDPLLEMNILDLKDSFR